MVVFIKSLAPDKSMFSNLLPGVKKPEKNLNNKILVKLLLM